MTPAGSRRRADMCKAVTTICLLLVATGSALARRLEDPSQSRVPDLERNKWALLIAGSAGWGNYRHQADLCHAYQVLHRGGIPDENIVVMMADDVANNPYNPHPGKLFNRPDGPDVYADVPKDYTGDDVNAKVFLDVLRGDAAAVAGIGSGRVIASGPQDHVFVYYVDHGAPGILGMPSGPFLYADELLSTLKNKSDAGGFYEMVMYVEACESGSIFEGLLNDEMNIYVTTAANPFESSWGTYCPGMDPSPPPEFTTCLGDLYSVAWLENSDAVDLSHETLMQQFDVVRRRTSNNFTYNQGSHVMQYGNFRFEKEVVGSYLGVNKNISERATADAVWLMTSAEHGEQQSMHSAVPSRDVPLVQLAHAYSTATAGPSKDAAWHALHAEVARRHAVDHSLRSALQALMLEDAQRVMTSSVESLTSSLLHRIVPYVRHIAPFASAQLTSLLTTARGRSHSIARGLTEPIADLIMEQPVDHRAGAPVVDDWDCLRGMVAAWERACGEPMDEYTMKHTRALANLCNLHVPPPQFEVAMANSGCQMRLLQAGSSQVDVSVIVES